MANVWRNGRWEDDSGTGNVLIGGAPGPNGTWAGGAWQNPQGQSFINNQWVSPYQAQSNVANAQQASLSSRYNVNQAQQNVMPYSYATLGAQRAVMPYRQATLNASRGVLAARQGTMPAQQGVLAARQGVLGAQGQQNAAQRGYIGQQQGEVEQRAGEFGAEQAALGNVQDQTAVATAQRYRAAKDARDRTLGITPSVEVNTAPGTVKLGEDIAPGVRAKLTTQFEDVQKANTVAQAKRGFELDRARLAVQMMGQNVDDARLIAEQAGLTLEQAQLLVTQAEYNQQGARLGEDQAGLGVDYAKLDEAEANLGVEGARLASDRYGLNVNQAQLDESLTNRAPFEGAEQYTDPYTGQKSWMTPAQADQRQFEYETQRSRERIPTNYQTGVQQKQYGQSQQSQAPLAGLSDAELISQLSRISPPGATMTPQVIMDELTRRYSEPAPRGEGLSWEQARAKALQLMEKEYERQRIAQQTQGRPQPQASGAVTP